MPGKQADEDGPKEPSEEGREEPVVGGRAEQCQQVLEGGGQAVLATARCPAILH